MKPINEYTDAELWNEIARRRVVEAYQSIDITMRPSMSILREELIAELQEQRCVIRGRFNEGCASDELVTNMIRRLQ
jgi:hypothetical protein